MEMHRISSSTLQNDVVERDVGTTEVVRPPVSRGGTADAAPVSLACYSCRKRKVKCDRQRPICSLCNKIEQICEYPAGPEKPGPKTRDRHSQQPAKRRRVDGHYHSSNSVQGNSLNAAGVAHEVSFDLPRRISVVSPGGFHNADYEASNNSAPVREADTQTAPIFSRIMYPSHEAQTRPQTPSPVADVVVEQPTVTVQSVLEALRISRETYDMLMDLYFKNMTSFSLFRPGSIEEKFSKMSRLADAEALVASMFSFSARHCTDQAGNCPKPSYFAHIAVTRLDESVNSYGDMGPPFWLMQAGILVTFYQLTQRVRSRSWNRLGNCVRYAYEFNLHIIDAKHNPSNTDSKTVDIQRWSLLEERRRAWWAVWEMDVFASTIRRLPTAIDASQNFTLLPVPDSSWFNDVYQESCLLVEDCGLRWKYLADSGNQSAKAWFIVVNSLMRNTQRIVYPPGSTIQPFKDRNCTTNQVELDIMANSLSCTIMSLPPSLTFQGETLHFGPNSRQEHADKYAIHLMTQLCRFMIYHHKICARAPWLASKHPPGDPSSTAQAHSEWSNYMNASDEIVTVVRSSSRDHYRYVNPFLANTLWFAAAAQCACGVFGPPTFNKRLTSSNLDLLKLTIDRFISFWDGMENLKKKLARIEAGLNSLMTNGNAGSDHRENHLQQPDRSNVDGGIVARNSPSVRNNQATTRSTLHPQDIGALPGTPTSTMLPATSMAFDGWAGEPRWISAFAPEISDFAQLFPMCEGQNFSGLEAIELSPFGLEELLMAGMNNCI